MHRVLARPGITRRKQHQITPKTKAMKYRYTINGELQAIIEAESKQEAYAVAVDDRNKYVRNSGLIKFSGCKLTPLN